MKYIYIYYQYILRKTHSLKFHFFKDRILSFAMKTLVILSCIDKFTSFNFVKIPVKL
jgi:hypothetical protein